MKIQPDSELFADLASVAEEIEVRRAELAAAGQSVENRELIREILKKKFLANESQPALAPAAPITQTASPVRPKKAPAGSDYLSNLDPTDERLLSEISSLAHEEGLEKALHYAEDQGAYAEDLFHDWLIKEHDRLKAEGVLK